MSSEHRSYGHGFQRLLLPIRNGSFLCAGASNSSMFIDIHYSGNTRTEFHYSLRSGTHLIFKHKIVEIKLFNYATYFAVPQSVCDLLSHRLMAVFQQDSSLISLK